MFSSKKILSILGLIFTANHLANAGIIIQGNGDCEVTDGESYNDNDLYIVSAADNSGPFNLGTSGSVRKVVKITGGGSSCNFDTTKAEYCVNPVTFEVSVSNEINRLQGFCDNTCNLYQCEDGYCSDTVITLPCRNNVVPCDPANNGGTCVDNRYYLVGSSLYKCTVGGSTSCDPINEIGYFINSGGDKGENPYIQCNKNGCSNLALAGTLTKDNCDDLKAGTLIYVESQIGYRLCGVPSGSGNLVPNASSAGDRYLIKVEDNTDNALRGKTPAHSYIVKAVAGVDDGINFVVDDASNGNYIVNNEKKLVSAENGTGRLVQCSGDDGTCNDVTTYGYLKNALIATHTSAPYIKCTGDNGCTAVSPSPVDAESGCSGKNDGEIVKISEAFKICIKGNPVGLTEGSFKYMVKINSGYAAQSPFSTLVGPDNFLNDKYVMVDVGTDATLHVQDKKKYRYTDANQKIYDNGTDPDAQSSVCDMNGGTIVEYTIDFCSGDDYDYYTKGEEKVWVQ